jgi:hypothetical protein
MDVFRLIVDTQVQTETVGNDAALQQFTAIDNKVAEVTAEMMRLREAIAKTNNAAEKLKLEQQFKSSAKQLDALNAEFFSLFRNVGTAAERLKILKGVNTSAFDTKQLALYKRELAAVQKEVNSLAAAGKQVQTSGGGGSFASSISAGFGLFLGGGILETVVALGREAVTTTANFETLRVRLEQLFGGDRILAEQYFDTLKNLADKTNFSFEQFADTFASLKGRGIVATSDELTKLADVSNFLSKPLDQLKEAILDVSNTERWTELGIKVQKEGNTIKGTLNGITVEAEATERGALDLVTALRDKIPEAAGATEAQSKTLAGAFSTLKDTFKGFLAELGDFTVGGGAGTGVLDFLTEITKSVTNLIGTLKQGAFNTGRSFAIADTFNLGIAEQGRLLKLLTKIDGEQKKLQSADISVKERLEKQITIIDNIVENELLDVAKGSDYAKALQYVADKSTAELTEAYNEQIKQEKKAAQTVKNNRDRIAAEQAKDAEKAAKEKSLRIQKAIKSATSDVSSELKKAEAALAAAENKADGSTLAGVRALAALDTTKDVEAVRDKFLKVEEKLKELGAKDTQIAGVKALYLQLETIVSRQSEIEAGEKISEFIRVQREKIQQLSDDISKAAFDADIQTLKELPQSTTTIQLISEAETKRQIEAVEKTYQQGIDAAVALGSEGAAQLAQLEQRRAQDIADLQTAAQTRLNQDLFAFLFERINTVENAYNDEVFLAQTATDRRLEILAKERSEGLIAQKEYESQKANILRDGEVAQTEIQRKIIANQIALIERLKQSLALSPEQTAEIENLLIKLNASQAALGKKSAEAVLPDTQKIETESQARKQAIQQIVNYTLDAIQTLEAAENKRLESDIARAEKRVELARVAAEKGGADSLEIEKRRLNDLLALREEAQDRQLQLNLVLQASNFALAASEAVKGITSAAEYGPAAPFIIAANVAAIIAGLVSLYSTFRGLNQQEFYEGGLYDPKNDKQGYTGGGSAKGVSNKLGVKPYKYHNKEFIFNAKTTEQWHDIFTDIHEGRLTPKVFKENVPLFFDYGKFEKKEALVVFSEKNNETLQGIRKDLDKFAVIYGENLLKLQKIAENSQEQFNFMLRFLDVLSKKQKKQKEAKPLPR